MRIDYWFDFQFALQVSAENSRHGFVDPNAGPSDMNLFRTIVDIKYYFDTRDLASAITFVGPHLIAGGGYYQRTDNIGSGSSTVTGTGVTSQNAFGFNFGGGLELTLKPKKTYLQIEALMHIVEFPDAYDPRFANQGIPDKTGSWITTGIALIWTW